MTPLGSYDLDIDRRYACVLFKGVLLHKVFCVFKLIQQKLIR
jgi:hypothetical protein